MPWWKRSRGQGSGIDHAAPAAHPAYGLHAGMDRAAIVERLGRPPKSRTTQEADREHWLYDVAPGQACRVVLAGDVLRSAEIDAPSADGGPAKTADMIRIDQEGSKTWRPVDAVKVVAARLAELSPIDQARLDTEYEVLRTAWGGSLEVGSTDQICGRLAADLDSDAAVLRGFEGFMVGPPQDVSTSIYSIYQPEGAIRGHGVAYRIWRVADGRAAMVRSSGEAPPPGEDRAYILLSGPDPGMDEIHKIAGAFRQDTGMSLDGMALRVFGASKTPDVDMVRSVVALEEKLNRLSPGSSERMIVRSMVIDGARHGIATVHTNERNPWVRGTIPEHLAKLEHDGNACARRPGWATLTSDSAMSFVANAQDGAVRRFDDIHIVVSTVPETDSARIRDLMPGGYTTWAEKVWATAGVSGDVDLAHWIVGTKSRSDAVHLCYVTGPPPRAILWPWDLLSVTEQQTVPRLA
jgi:hypothetical protein